VRSIFSPHAERGSTRHARVTIEKSVRDIESEVSTAIAALRRVAELEAALAKTSAKLAQMTSERDRLRRAYDRVLEEMELMRRRLFVAKAERIDVRQLEIEFAQKKAELEALGAALDVLPRGTEAPPPEKKPRTKNKGRRDLFAVDMPEERVELLDQALEGKAERIGFEESCRLGYRRGGPVRIVVARATYKVLQDADGQTALVTVPRPKELFERCLLAPSMFARLLISKYQFGLPFFRCEEMLAKDGIALDRGAMSRYAEDCGATLGPIVDACANEAKKTAFCLATDATGVAIQPTPLPEKGRQPCRKSHFFVVLADRDHIFFEYKPKHSSDAVCDMFRGFSGYVQADAHAVYDALYRGDAVESGVDPPQEVACWAHVRRKFWEAATAKFALGREGLFRIRMLFELEESWADLPPQKRRDLRQGKLRLLIDDFFTWAHAEYERHKDERGLVATMFGYAVRQEAALRRFLDDGRLRMDNNPSERELRRIATGRKAWLFFGSDDHAAAAANLFSLIASCKLHALDAEAYLADVIRVMPYWPRDRYLELAPKYWAATRARLDPVALARPVGEIVVPAATAAQEPTAS
jgi:transposase